MHRGRNNITEGWGEYWGAVQCAWNSIWDDEKFLEMDLWLAVVDQQFVH